MPNKSNNTEFNEPEVSIIAKSYLYKRLYTGKLWQPSTWFRFENTILIKPCDLLNFTIVNEKIDINQS